MHLGMAVGARSKAPKNIHRSAHKAAILVILAPAKKRKVIKLQMGAKRNKKHCFYATCWKLPSQLSNRKEHNYEEIPTGMIF